MPQQANPVAKFADATDEYQDVLSDLWKGVFKKVDSALKPMIAFGSKLISKGKDIARTVGLSVMKTIESAFKAVTGMLKSIPALIKRALALGKEIIALVRKAADPGKVVKALRKLFSRYVAMLREIFSAVSQFIDQLDAMGTALAVVEKFKTVLQFVVSWIGEVSGASGAVKRARGVLATAHKSLSASVRKAEKLNKEVMKLKPAA